MIAAALVATETARRTVVGARRRHASGTFSRSMNTPDSTLGSCAPYLRPQTTCTAEVRVTAATRSTSARVRSSDRTQRTVPGNIPMV
jgi:hypothetical protein